MNSSLFASFHPIAAIATTPLAIQTLAPLCQTMGATLYTPEDYTGSLQTYLGSIWAKKRAFIFSMATGAVVRLIAPFLHDKAIDPAIIVLDPHGKFVISLCSGHQGGADHLTRLIAQQLDATPILTSASDAQGLPAIDILGVPFGWRKGSGDWLGVSAAIARQETVQVIQEVGSSLWQTALPENHPFYFGFPEIKATVTPKARIWISAVKRKFAEKTTFAKVQWHPRVLWLGIGCIRGVSAEFIDKAIKTTLQRGQFASEAIAGIATLDLKADESGLLGVCQQRQLPLRTFTPEQLRQIRVPNPSEIVENAVNTPSVAEASAILASGNGDLLMAKQVFKTETEAVTVAIAQATVEYTGREGKLYLVGTGPGSLEQITPAAKTALTQADVIVGYGLYLELIDSLRRPGQIIESFSLTQEKKRAERAIELANWGLTVAVVSSGDCGIYGMAGLVFEVLREQGWQGKSPKIEVFPGITALQAVASRVGAPIMHDFCGISLSDLLTPWEVIENRLESAAKADFVTALYNPRSQQRTKPLAMAHRIFLRYRDAQTPVALVRSVYRADESITITNLDKMLDFPIDMLTTILIGNHSTRQLENWLITPRGYFPS